jgi:hypothetical protein
VRRLSNRLSNPRDRGNFDWLIVEQRHGYVVLVLLYVVTFLNNVGKMKMLLLRIVAPPRPGLLDTWFRSAEHQHTTFGEAFSQ